MSTSVTFNGSSFTVPATGEEDWGGSSKVDGLLISVAQNALSKAGGTFALTAEVDFSSTAGLKSLYYKSRGTNVSTTGVVRLASAEAVGFRNNANSADLLLTTDASDNLTFNGHIIDTSGGVVPVAGGGTGLSSYTTGDTLYASGVATLSKLAIGSVNTVLVSTGSAPSYALVVNANIDSAAAISFTKLASLTSAHILVGNGSNVAVDVAVSGDITISNSGVTAIGSAKVTNAMLAGSIAASNLVGTDIVTVGTVTSGTWSATAIAATKGGTGQSSFTTGDILYASSSSAISKLAVGSSGQFLKVSGGLPSWGSSASLAVSAKTTTYAILNTDDALTADTSGAGFTMTLPDCATNSGKVFRIKKVTSDFNVLTISRAGSDTIQDAAQTSTITINTLGEEIDIVSFGSTIWQVMNRRVPGNLTTFTPTGTWTTNSTYTGVYSRRGANLKVYFRVAFAGAPDVGSFTINLPSGLTIDSTVVASQFTQQFGQAALQQQSAANWYSIQLAYNTSSSLVGLIPEVTGSFSNLISNAFTKTVPITIGSTAFVEGNFEVPISGWNG